MGNCFKIYGPFEIENKQKIVNKEHQIEYWSDCVDKQYYDLSFAKGIYLFSLRNAENYNPQYVGIPNEILEQRCSTIEHSYDI
jgi:hypothetical protein